MVTPSPSGHSISWPHLNGDMNDNDNENKMNFPFIDLPPQVKNDPDPGSRESDSAHLLELTSGLPPSAASACAGVFYPCYVDICIIIRTVLLRNWLFP